MRISIRLYQHMISQYLQAYDKPGPEFKNYELMKERIQRLNLFAGISA